MSVLLKQCAFPDCTNEFPEHYFSDVCGAKHVFLGGTVGNNYWRDDFTETLVSCGVSSGQIFNPVVKDWNDEAKEREGRAKANADFLVFYIADPRQEGNPLSAYSMAEAAMALYDKPERTVVVFDTEGMSGHPLKVTNQVLRDLRERFPGTNIFSTPQEATDWLVPVLKLQV